MQTEKYLRIRTDDHASQNGNLLLVFLIWPLMGCILAFRDFGNKFNRGIILSFFALYGFTFYINPLMDGDRYADKLKFVYNQPTSEIATIFQTMFAEQGSLDFVQPVLTFILSRFTDSHHWLFAAFALLFGYFHLKIIGILYNEYNSTRTRNALLFLIFIFFVNPITNINGFRMWTAAWIFFYGVYSYLTTKEKRFLLVAALSITVHFSFFLPVAVLAIYVFLGNRNVIYAPLAIGSFFLSELPMPAIKSYVAGIGGGLERKFNAYSNESYTQNVQELVEKAAWFMQIAPTLLLYSFLIVFITIYFRRKKIQTSAGFENLLSFTLLYMTFMNIASLMPSGARFRSIFYLLATALFIVYYSKYYVRKRLPAEMYFVICGMILSMLITIRVSTETINTVLFLPSPFTLFFYDAPMPVKDWLF